jgi:DMSO/TMAO reductase YedYZ molybdopterin-dependent catalytic subunit
MTATETRAAAPVRSPGPVGAASAALAGGVAAGAALAAGELPSALAGEQSSPVVAVGNEFVDRYAATLKDLAVALFGQNDKTALLVGIVTISLVLGAGLGVLARRRFWAAAGGYAGFGAVGALALASDAGSGPVMAVGSAGLAVLAGIATLAALLGRLGAGPHARTVPPAPVASTTDALPGRDPTVRSADRRSFLVLAGAVGASAAVVGVAGHNLRSRSTVATQREALVLPPGAVASPIPATGLIDVAGVSPYVTPIADFYRIDTALVLPQVDVDSWRLRISGLVDEPRDLTFADLLGMDLVEQPVTIACVSNEVGGDLVGNAVWLGVPLADVLERAGVRPEGTQVVGRSVDGFTVGFPTDVALDGRVAMIAIGMNGEPLPVRHGFPARLIVAGLYGYVSATKWLDEIELTRFEDFDAYWVPRGWSKLGPIKTQSRIDVPRAGSPLPPGPTVVAGVAFAPDVGIAGVEIQADGGPWQQARLGATAGDDTWVQWVHHWDATPGPHELRVRATDRTGTTQTPDEAPPRPDGATGHHTVRVDVRDESG